MQAVVPIIGTNLTGPVFHLRRELINFHRRGISTRHFLLKYCAYRRGLQKMTIFHLDSVEVALESPTNIKVVRRYTDIPLNILSWFRLSILWCFVPLSLVFSILRIWWPISFFSSWMCAASWDKHEQYENHKQPMIKTGVIKSHPIFVVGSNFHAQKILFLHHFGWDFPLKKMHEVWVGVIEITPCTTRTFHLGIAGWQFLQLARGVEVLSSQLANTYGEQKNAISHGTWAKMDFV